MVRFHAGDLAGVVQCGPALLVQMPDSNKSMQRGEKRALADTEDVADAADDTEED